MSNNLNDLIADIMKEVEKIPETKKESQEKIASIKDSFDTLLGSSLYKVSQLCREINTNLDKVTYEDMKAFWEK